MVELLVMRHAKSAWDTGHDDFDRPLNSRGRGAAGQMAQWLVDNDLEPDTILSSSAERTRSTAMAVMFECAVDRAQVHFEDHFYLASAFDWIFHLQKQTSDRLLICGHNPGLDDLVEFLSIEPPEVTATGKLMTTAAIAYLVFDHSWVDIGANTATLVSLARPREV